MHILESDRDIEPVKRCRELSLLPCPLTFQEAERPWKGDLGALPRFSRAEAFMEHNIKFGGDIQTAKLFMFVLQATNGGCR